MASDVDQLMETALEECQDHFRRGFDAQSEPGVALPELIVDHLKERVRDSFKRQFDKDPNRWQTDRDWVTRTAFYAGGLTAFHAFTGGTGKAELQHANTAMRHVHRHCREPTGSIEGWYCDWWDGPGEIRRDARSSDDDRVTSSAPPTTGDTDAPVVGGAPVVDDRPVDEGDVEDGFDVLTHGGGEIESVPGFDAAPAMVKGIGSMAEVPFDRETIALQDAGDLEFGVQESVCDLDERAQVRGTIRIPWRTICQLFITWPDGSRSKGTGWFIAPRTLMTAGHCVFSHRHGAGTWAASIEVIPGMNERIRPFGSAVGASFHSVEGWTAKKQDTHDYGCIILPEDQPLGRKTGWWGFANLHNDAMRNLLVNNGGYPGDKTVGTQWYTAGRITDVRSHWLSYMLDTAGGQSGGPTWRRKDGKRHAVGIHAYGGCPNRSVRINRAVFDNMRAWKSQGA